MYQKDYILRLIEEAAKVLARIAGLMEKGQAGKAQEELDYIWDELLKLDRDELLNDLDRGRMNFDTGLAETVADLLKTEGETELTKGNKASAFRLYTAALHLYGQADIITRTWSPERKDKMDEIRKIVQ
ncbi:MAG: hypothetical protein KJ607_07100 [Bacteroidetes bacterium]|nr:hypothetical protein [Bacteroidota bacterium]